MAVFLPGAAGGARCRHDQTKSTCALQDAIRTTRTTSQAATLDSEKAAFSPRIHGKAALCCLPSSGTSRQPDRGGRALLGLPSCFTSTPCALSVASSKPRDMHTRARPRRPSRS
eukprot:scaffold9005_cov39-Tisochrysis_lutea.AAC.2